MTTHGARRAELAEAFDAAFAAPPPAPAEAHERLIGIRAGEAYALRLAELAGLAPVPAIVPLPGARPELLGLAGLRGRLVAVFDLAMLLGHSAGPAPRWLALPADGAAVAVAFSELEAHHLAPASARVPTAGASGPIAELLVLDGVRRAVIDLPALLAPLAPPDPPQETPAP